MYRFAVTFYADQWHKRKETAKCERSATAPYEMAPKRQGNTNVTGSKD
jgi:hypothetical protein